MREIRMRLEVIAGQRIAGRGSDRLLPNGDRMSDDLGAGVAVLPCVVL